MTIFALIPACGHSRRMGRPKLSLPLAGRTVLERVIAALSEAGVGPIVVVVGPHVPELIPIAESAGAVSLALPQETPDMRATVEAGLRHIEERWAPQSEDAWLLVPADHPTLEAGAVRRLLHERAAHPEATIFVPTFDGRRGHPALIGWGHVAGMRALPADQGLNAYLRQQAVREVPVETAAVLADLDTPADYERLREGERRGD